MEECIQIGLSLTTALRHLHEHGLVHRDCQTVEHHFVHGVPKLADIGLVASMDATMSFVGTSGFLPPEGPGTVERIPDPSGFDLKSSWDEEWEKNLLAPSARARQTAGRS